MKDFKLSDQFEATEQTQFPRLYLREVQQKVFSKQPKFISFYLWDFFQCQIGNETKCLSRTRFQYIRQKTEIKC